MKKSQSGFTILELMIVIAVIGLFAIVLVPKTGIAKDSAKEAGLITDMTYIQGHLLIQIDKYPADRRFPDTEHSNYNTDYLAGKMESILECNGGSVDEYNNFDGYQNPFSQNKTILGTSRTVEYFESWLPGVLEPAIYITNNNQFAYSPSSEFTESDYVNGTIILYIANGQNTAEMYYVDRNGRPCNHTVVSP